MVWCECGESVACEQRGFAFGEKRERGAKAEMVWQAWCGVNMVRVRWGEEQKGRERSESGEGACVRGASMVWSREVLCTVCTGVP